MDEQAKVQDAVISVGNMYKVYQRMGGVLDFPQFTKEYRQWLEDLSPNPQARKMIQGLIGSAAVGAVFLCEEDQVDGNGA